MKSNKNTLPAKRTIQFLFLVIIASFAFQGYSQDNTLPEVRGREEITIKVVVSDGGRLDWSHKNDLIAFDRLNRQGFYDVWIMKPDGTGQICLTCGIKELENRHNGNPAWHPSGEWIVFQSVDSGLIPKRFPKDKVNIKTNPGAGWLNNLWVINTKNKKVYQLTRVGIKGGVLHPHFSHDGSKLFWSQRLGRGDGVMGEWTLKVADFKVKDFFAIIENVKTYQPNCEKRRFYESHGFSPDNRSIIFSANPEAKQSQLGFDIYMMDLASGKVRKLTDTPDEWDEHAIISPDGEKIVWMSSQGIPNPDLAEVKSDFWLMDKNGENKRRLTYFNDWAYPEYMPIEGGVACADSSWNKEGTKLAVYVKTGRQERTGAILIIDFTP